MLLCEPSVYVCHFHYVCFHFYTQICTQVNFEVTLQKHNTYTAYILLNWIMYVI